MIASFRQNASRYIAAGIAIILCSIFATMAMAFVEITKFSQTSGLKQEVAGAGAVIRFMPGETKSEKELSALFELQESGAPYQKALEGNAKDLTFLPLDSYPITIDLNTAQTDNSFASAYIVRPAEHLEPILVEGKLPQATYPNLDFYLNGNHRDAGLADSQLEVVVDTNFAKTFDVKIGDQLPWSYTEFSEQGEEVRHQGKPLKLVGIVEGAVLSGSKIYIQPQVGATFASWNTLELGVYGPSGSKDAEILNQVKTNLSTSRVAGVPLTDFFQVRTSAEDVEKRSGGNDANTNLALRALAMLFPTLAAAVGIVVVGTTFQVMLTLRVNELALLRCVGASKRQIRRMVLAEALLLGLCAGMIGTVIGMAGAVGLMLYTSLAHSLFTALAVIGWLPPVTGVAMGLVITVLAALRPAAAAIRTDPLVALRPVENAASESPKRRVGRKIFAVLLTVFGGADLAWTLTRSFPADQIDPVLTNFLIGILSGLALFFGILMLLTVLSPWIVRLVTLPFAARSMPVQLARDNIVRQPRRASATIASVVLGLSLVTTLVVGAFTLNTTLKTMFATTMPVDMQVVVKGNESGGIEPKLLAQLQQQSGVEAVDIADQYKVKLGPGNDPRQAKEIVEIAGGVNATAFPVVAIPDKPGSLDPKFVSIKPGEISLPKDYVEKSPVDRLELELNGVRKTFRVVTTHLSKPTVLSSDFREFKAVAPLIQSEHQPFTPEQEQAIQDGKEVNPKENFGRLASPRMWVRMDPNLHSQELMKASMAIDKAMPTLNVIEAPVTIRAMVEYVISIVLQVTLSLLAATIVIALIGVMNTLSLAVVARKRETAMLRAVGLTRSQLRFSILVEAMLIGGLATVIGVAGGTAMAFAGLKLLPLIDVERIYAVPWLYVAAIAAGGMLITYLASIIPARMALRTTPIQALQHT